MKSKLLALIALPLTMGLVSCSDGLDALLLGSLMGDSGFFGDYYEDYDMNGIPIYGYDGGQAVYGYNSYYQPIYSPSGLSNAAYVPGWAPRSGARVVYPSRAQRMMAPPRNAKHKFAGPGGLRGSSRRVHHAAQNAHHHTVAPGNRHDKFDFNNHSNRNDRLGGRPNDFRNNRHNFGDSMKRHEHFGNNAPGAHNDRHSFNNHVGNNGSRFGGLGGTPRGGKEATRPGKSDDSRHKSDSSRHSLKGRH